MLAFAVERDAWDPDRHPTRFTVDLLRPVAMAPVRLRTNVVREGKRLKLVDVAPKYAWVRELTPLVDGVPLTPFVRAALAGDITSSLAQFGSEGSHYINPDYTVTLTRLPDGPDIGLAAVSHHHHVGIATGVATLFDRLGPIGSAVATGLAHSGFRPPAD